MVETLVGKEMLVRLVHPEKASLPMLVTFAGMMTSPPLPLYFIKVPSLISNSGRMVEEVGVTGLGLTVCVKVGREVEEGLACS